MNTQETITFRHYRPVGAECIPTTVTVRLADSVAGLDARQRETSIRIRAAIEGLGEVETPRAIVVEDPINAWDLPVAIAVLTHLGRAHRSALHETLFIGDLGLSGKVNRARHEAALASAALQRKSGFTRVVAPLEAQHRENSKDVRGVATLRDAVRLARGEITALDLPPVRSAQRNEPRFSMADVSGLERAKAELRTAIQGGARRVLLVGDAGAGRTMLARRLAEYLPRASVDAETGRKVDAVYSAAGLDLLAHAPFRAPHHTVSEAGLLGTKTRPGELALAYTGTLLLDEVLELGSRKLETVLRTIGDGRRDGWPCQPALLVAASNLCPCGQSAARHCRCTSAARAAWEKRLTETASHFDIVVRVTADDVSLANA